MPEMPVIGIRLPPEELAVLEEIERVEERTRSDVIRRAIRLYAAKLGIKSKSEKRKKGA